MHTPAHDESHVEPRKRVTVRVLTTGVDITSSGLTEQSFTLDNALSPCWGFPTSLLFDIQRYCSLFVQKRDNYRCRNRCRYCRQGSKVQAPKGESRPHARPNVQKFVQISRVRDLRALLVSLDLSSIHLPPRDPARPSMLRCIEA